VHFHFLRYRYASPYTFYVRFVSVLTLESIVLFVEGNGKFMGNNTEPEKVFLPVFEVNHFSTWSLSYTVVGPHSYGLYGVKFFKQIYVNVTIKTFAIQHMDHNVNKSCFQHQFICSAENAITSPPQLEKRAFKYIEIKQNSFDTNSISLITGSCCCWLTKTLVTSKAWSRGDAGHIVRICIACDLLSASLCYLQKSSTT
jgi:hypothetical protein